MYTSPDDARSDLLLSAGVFVLLPVILSLLLPMGLRGVPGQVLDLVTAFVLTGLVPLLLMRYRGEAPAGYGIAPGRAGDAAAGLADGAPFVAVGAVGALGIVPSLQPGVLIALVAPVALAARIVGWVGLTFLAGYCTSKARDAFRSERIGLDEGVAWIGRPLALVGLATVVLLVLAPGGPPVLGAVLPLAAAAATVLLALRRARSRLTTTKAVLLTPTILVALGTFQLVFNATALIVSLYLTSISAAVGLTVAVYVESRDSVVAGLALGLVLALFTNLRFVV